MVDHVKAMVVAAAAKKATATNAKPKKVRESKEVLRLIKSLSQKPEHRFMWAHYEETATPSTTEACGYVVVRD